MSLIFLYPKNGFHLLGWIKKRPGHPSLNHRDYNSGTFWWKREGGKGWVKGPVLDSRKSPSSRWSVSKSGTQECASPPHYRGSLVKDLQAGSGWVNFLFVTEATGICTCVCSVWLEDGLHFIPWSVLPCVRANFDIQDHKVLFHAADEMETFSLSSRHSEGARFIHRSF